MKKRLIISITIILAITAIAFLLLQSKAQQVKFKLIDGDTGMPISNQQIFICDDAIKFKYIGEFPFPRFCYTDEDDRWLKKANTDSNGVFSLNINENYFDIKPPTDIVFDIGDSDPVWGIAKVERSDSLGHTYHPSFIRVINSERSGRVISNKLYNLETNEVKEIFTSDNSEKISTFDTIDLIIFKKE